MNILVKMDWLRAISEQNETNNNAKKPPIKFKLTFNDNKNKEEIFYHSLVNARSQK